MMTTLAWMGAGMGQIPLLREFGQDLGGKRPQRHRDGAEGVKSKSRTSGKLCKNCNPYRQIFPASEQMAHCTRNKIAQGAPAALRLLLNLPLRFLSPGPG